jgi:hypothetical protein
VWRVVSDELHNFESEQDEWDMNGNVIENARTLAYTAQLLQEVADRITQFEHDLEECRIRLNQIPDSSRVRF